MKFSPPQKTPYYWFLCAATLLLVMSILFLFGSASELSGSATELKNLTVEMPKLEDYVTNQKFDFNLKGPSRRLKAGDIPKLVDDAMAPINADDAINKTFQYFAEFENKRSAPVLTLVIPTVSAVTPGSPADLAGIKAGDTISFVGGAKIESVMGFYLALGEKPGADLVLKLVRNKKDPMTFNLRATGGTTLTPDNCGIGFSVPADSVYLGERDIKRLAEQYKANSLNRIAIDWRQASANNLMMMAKRLSLMPKLVSDSSAGNAAQIRFADLLAWQHKKMLENIDAYFSQRRKIENRNVVTLGSLGDSVLAFVSSLVIFAMALLLFVYQRKVGRKK